VRVALARDGPEQAGAPTTNPPDIPTKQFGTTLFRKRGQLNLAEPDLPSVGRQNSRSDLKQRRLALRPRTHHCHDLTTTHPERHIYQHPQTPPATPTAKVQAHTPQGQQLSHRCDQRPVQKASHRGTATEGSAAALPAGDSGPSTTARPSAAGSPSDPRQLDPRPPC
jgi:hypothetical protein